MKECIFKEGQLVKCISTGDNCFLEVGKLYIISCIFNCTRINVYDPILASNDVIHRTNIIIDTWVWDFVSVTADEVSSFIEEYKMVYTKKIERMFSSIDALNGNL